jgi:hypothetical protein
MRLRRTNGDENLQFRAAATVKERHATAPISRGFSTEFPWAARLWGGPPGLRLTSRSASFGPPKPACPRFFRGVPMRLRRTNGDEKPPVERYSP